MQTQYAPQLTEALLVAKQATSGSGFVAYCQELGIWDERRCTPDHIAGVRDRLLAVNLNVMGSKSWTDSSWDIFSQRATLTSTGRGGRVGFLEAIFEDLEVGEEARSLVKEQLELMNCLVRRRIYNATQPCARPKLSEEGLKSVEEWLGGRRRAKKHAKTPRNHPKTLEHLEKDVEKRREM